MKDIGTFEVIVALLVTWGVVELIRGYWQILLALAAFVALVYVIFRDDKKTVTPSSTQEYEVRRAKPQLPPMPYSTKPVELKKPSQSKLPPMPYSSDYVAPPSLTADEVVIARLKETFFESLEIVTMSDNIQTVDNRFDVCLRAGLKLAEAGELDAEHRLLLFDDEQRATLFNQAADRYITHQKAELASLRTGKGKRDREAKIISIINGLEHMPARSKSYAKMLLKDDVDATLDRFESGASERYRKVYDKYFRLVDEIRNSRDIGAKLNACEASLKILPQFVKANLDEYGELPPTIPCRDETPKLYMQLGQWSKARAAISKCIKAGVYADDGVAALDNLARYELAAETALAFLRRNQGYLQRKIYSALPDVDKDCLKNFIRTSQLIRKEPDGSTNKLYVAEETS